MPRKVGARLPVIAFARLFGSMTGRCALCEREEVLTRHHLIPRTRHHNKRNKRKFDRAVVHRTVGLCPPCHRQVHALFTEKQLEREYSTVESLREHPAMEEFLAWIRSKPGGFRCPARKSAGLAS